MHVRKGPVVFAFLLAASLVSTSHAQLNRRPGGRPAPSDGRRPFVTPDMPRQTEPVRTFDVRHIKGELTLDTKASEVRGTVTHTIAPLYPDMASLTLDCASDLKVSKVAVAPKDQDKGKPGECKFERKGDTIAITLDRPYKLDETFDLQITYSGSPKKGIYFIPPGDEKPEKPFCVWTQGESQETRHWLPCYDHPNDRATSEMVVTVPKAMSVLSNGTLVETKENSDGTSTFHWKMDVPHSSYLISLAASEFNVVHDKAGDLPVDYYVLKTVDEATARRAMGKTPKMIKFFADKIGQPYPYTKYAQVIVPEFTNGGMENISATTLNEFIIGDATTYLEMDSDSLVAHELAHQWFGDLLTCREWSHIWLNEGFASYFDPLYSEHEKGEDFFRLNMEGQQRAYKMGDHSVRRAMVETHYRSPDDLFEGVTYAKGASVLHSLRGLIGDDAWWRGIKGYVAANKAAMVDTDDFKKAMEKASGKDLGWFFDQWVHHGGHPELKASWRYETDDQTVRLKVEQTQAVDDLTPLFRIPTTAEVADDSGVRNVAVVIDGKTHEFVIPSPARPRSVRIDPKGWWIKELEFERSPEEWVFILDHSADVLGRVEAARALGKKSGDDKAVEAVSKAWSREQEPLARVEMVRQLDFLGDKATPALIEAAKDKSARVRVVAFQALSRKKASPELEALFRAAWDDKKEAYGVRNAALSGLAAWKVKDKAELIAAGLETPSDHDTVATTALKILLREPGPKSRENAVLYSRPGRPVPLREAAIQTLAGLVKDDPQVAAALTELVKDPIRNIRRNVWWNLSQYDVRSALPALEAQLKVEPAKDKSSLEMAIANLKRARPRRPTTPSPAVAIVSDSKAEVTEMERQAAELELQAKELRNKAEALKLKDERSKVDAAKAKSSD